MKVTVQDGGEFSGAFKMNDVANARFRPGTLGTFVHHQDWVAFGRYIEAALLKGSGKIKQIHALQDKGGIDVMPVKAILQLIYPVIKFWFRRV